MCHCRLVLHVTHPIEREEITVVTPTRATATLSRLSRNALLAGVGAAIVLGIATPSFANSAAPAPKPAVAHTRVVSPPMSQLEHGKPTNQSSITLSGTQKANAAAIVKASKEMRLPARAAVIAVATAMQESALHNYGNLGSSNDHDSLGLFQQRPSAGWGSPRQCEQPDHAAKSFLSRLVKVHNWQKMPLTDAAQAVQVSAFGDRYAKWEAQSAGLVAANLATTVPVTH